ncbi:MAG: T9SS type A sorting domain-containing protein [Candidatus Krumholzibacteriota bacterium]|nr:T9SS type A sorting domain-containing protein [Candidatus Krumholzibacteriota bacterium]
MKTTPSRIHFGSKTALTGALVSLLLMAAVAPAAQAITTAALLDSVQHRAFDYFWNEANPANGLVKDRSTSGSPASIAAVGFGLSAICIGIDHGWITRDQGRERVLTTLTTFWNGPQGSEAAGTMGYKGFFYHFLDMSTGTRVWNCELSSIDTALLIAGVLDASQYFTGGDAEETEIRILADSLFQRVDWEFMRNWGVGIRMGWKPESGFAEFGTWVGYNEAMILYILALGSPTHPVPASTWFTWTSGYQWSTQYGQEYVIFPPLFGHQYSHCWIDYRNRQDIYMASKGITYFENSRRATLAAQAYCVDNPLGHVGYSELVWGLTASDDPWGYGAHGAPPAQNDNGTITPTAAASSIAFAPEIVIPTLHHLYDSYPSELWGPYGFKDAFNLDQGWWATDYIGIDQGPIVIMIENYHNESVWWRFMQSPYVQDGLATATFLPITASHDAPASQVSLAQNAPNPFHASSIIRFQLQRAGHVSLRVYDIRGRRVATLVDGWRAAGEHRVPIEARDLCNGVYFYVLESDGATTMRRCVVLR